MLNGLKIRKLKNSKGYTTLDISKFTHISKSYIEKLERGAKQNPSFNKAVALANFLRV